MLNKKQAVRVNDETEWEKLPCPVCNEVDFEFLFEKQKEPFVKCKSCTLVMINPRPKYKHVLDTYDYDYGEMYWRKKDKKIRRIKPWVSKIKQKYINKGRWLDIGCSVGFVVYCADKAGFESYGIDVEEHGLKNAREKLGLKRIFHGTLEEQKFQNDFFDVISIYDVIEHVPDLNSFCSEIKRILSPKGIVDIRTPDVGHWRIPRDLSQWAAIIPSEHLYNFNIKSLGMLLDNHGLKIVNKRFNLKPGLKIFVKHLD